ncbi:MAG: hypothetical protein GWN30_35835 [Gammaproteobacteria bacterium]|nr:hypothetical protein [Gammaproteobacteria bacterium]NIX00596.1 hypothetical protein [Phycisphaerae bacterium]
MVTLDTDTLLRTGEAGQVVSYTLTLKNSGSVTDSYTVIIDDRLGRDIRFQTSLYGNGYDGALYTGELAPQAQIPITVWVRIPSSPMLDVLSNTVTIRAIGFYDVSDDIELVTLISSFQEANGQVIMEAENFASQKQLGGHFWLSQTKLNGYVGSGYINGLPDTDLRFVSVYSTNPELRYTINLTTTGVYTVWLRGYAPNAAGDSVYIGLDETTPITLTGFVPGEWRWASSDANSGVVRIEVTEPGLHTFYLWQREDGLRLDRILLTTNSGYNPSGNGPPESEFR